MKRPNLIGRAKLSYAAAQEIPEILQKLFCYCGCDHTSNHTSLFDCFTSDEAIDCTPFCGAEAMMAFKMHRKGSSVADIQKAIDLAWCPHYPFFEQPSEALLNYRKTRLWAPGKGLTTLEEHNDAKRFPDPFGGSQD